MFKYDFRLKLKFCVCFFLGIWKNLEYNSVCYFYSINVFNIDCLFVFIGILWIRDEEDWFVNVMEFLIIV